MSCKWNFLYYRSNNWKSSLSHLLHDLPYWSDQVQDECRSKWLIKHKISGHYFVLVARHSPGNLLTRLTREVVDVKCVTVLSEPARCSEHEQSTDDYYHQEGLVTWTRYWTVVAHVSPECLLSAWWSPARAHPPTQCHQFVCNWFT